MKKAYTSFLGILLAVIVLISGMSFTVKKMVCLSSGNVEVGLYSIEGCCSDDGDASCEEAKLDSKCCDYSSQVFTLDNDVLLKEPSSRQLDPAFIQIIPAYIFSLRTEVQPEPQFSFADPPPLLYGRQLLSAIGILII